MTRLAKESLVEKRTVERFCTRVHGQTFTVSHGPARILRLSDEWYEDVRDPVAVIETLSAAAGNVDIFTFWQRYPDIEPKYGFHTDWEELAVLPVTTFEEWWQHGIKARTRSLIRKCERQGVEVRNVNWSDDFVRGMCSIFNESPVRQGRAFSHYGKTFETVKTQFSRFLFRERLIGAYYHGELIGFMFIGNAGRYALTGQILSKLSHRKKATNNALIAKAVEVCCEERWPYLVYLYWGSGSFSEFKRRCGFERIRVPRYYVPLTRRGKLMLKLGLHNGIAHAIPPVARQRLKGIRRYWLNRRMVQPEATME